jgi:hypothetical protein
MLPAVARAQASGVSLPQTDPSAPNAPLAVRPIEPQNALEYAFVQALTNENMRPIFRHYLMDTHVALAMSSAEAGAEPKEVVLQNGAHAIAVFTSSERVDTVLGEDAPRIMIAGRAAFERARGKNIVINYHLIPMLTLEPDDVAGYLAAQPGVASAGPSQ